MSEILDNREQRKKILKHLILKLNEDSSVEPIKNQIKRLLGKIPYNDVVEVEQELIKEGMEQNQIIKLCDLHSKALEGNLASTQEIEVPKGHPIHTFKQENKSIIWEVDKLIATINEIKEKEKLDTDDIYSLKEHFNNLTDIDKHYKRKENLLFPYLEKKGITGPSQVMWGKHDEIREQLKQVKKSLDELQNIEKGEFESVSQLLFLPLLDAIKEMIFKEEEILIPMSFETLTEDEWKQIYLQTPEYGYCLYNPVDKWEFDIEEKPKSDLKEKYLFETGSLTVKEIESIFNTIPFDLTFVDKDDRVKYFTAGKERIFYRSKAIIGRKVQNCHPPKSIEIVEKILSDFKTGKKDKESFWINLDSKFIIIEYFAVRDEKGNYLGCIEVSQDLTEKRKLQGEKRLLEND